MGMTIAAAPVRMERKTVASACPVEARLESVGKSVAVRCLDDAIAASNVPRKALADECGWSEGHFSKVASGQQGDLLDLVYRLPESRAAIRRDFFARLAETEFDDPLERAAEQMAMSAIRFLTMARRAGVRRRVRA